VTRAASGTKAPVMDVMVCKAVFDDSVDAVDDQGPILTWLTYKLQNVTHQNIRYIAVTQLSKSLDPILLFSRKKYRKTLHALFRHELSGLRFCVFPRETSQKNFKQVILGYPRNEMEY
jgi:hypothetical protein